MKTEVSQSQSTVLGIDIGGTGIKAAPVNVQSGKLVEDPLRLPTPQPAKPTQMLSVINEMLHQFNWQGHVGCGFPGVVKKGQVFTAANLSKDWIGVNLTMAIQKLTSSSVAVINDADAAGLAEMQFGAGKPHNKHGGGVVLIVTLGTGIGTALFVNGHLVPNTELGHIEIGGMEAEKRAATVIREREGLSWKEWGNRVNIYLQTLEFLLSPDVFIIGGGVSASCEQFFPFLDVQAKIVSAELQNDAGIVGAALVGPTRRKE